LVFAFTKRLYRRVRCGGVKEQYAFIKSHTERFPVRLMCSVLQLHYSGYYHWLKEPRSESAKEDEYLLGFIKQLWLESGCVYGYRKIYTDLVSIGEGCGKHLVLILIWLT